jgi:hypothetical protein
VSKWTSRWTCPGFMFVPRQAWPMGNEYHSMCCALSGIMYWIELVEGKDRPPELDQPEYNSLGENVPVHLSQWQARDPRQWLLHLERHY